MLVFFREPKVLFLSLLFFCLRSVIFLFNFEKRRIRLHDIYVSRHFPDIIYPSSSSSSSRRNHGILLSRWTRKQQQRLGRLHFHVRHLQIRPSPQPALVGILSFRLTNRSVNRVRFLLRNLIQEFALEIRDADSPTHTVVVATPGRVRREFNVILFRRRPAVSRVEHRGR